VTKPRPAVWRDAVRDSELGSTTKLVGFVLSTYLNGSGLARHPGPGRQTLARGCSLTDRAVDEHLRLLEAAGYLQVEWSKGGRSRTHGFTAVLPETANEVRRSEWGKGRTSRPERANVATRNGERRSPESGFKAKEKTGGLAAAAANGRAAPLIDDDCMDCGERRPVAEYPDGRVLCEQCAPRPVA
jgi:hypothetical protein